MFCRGVIFNFTSLDSVFYIYKALKEWKIFDSQWFIWDQRDSNGILIQHFNYALFLPEALNFLKINFGILSSYGHRRYCLTKRKVASCRMSKMKVASYEKTSSASKFIDQWMSPPKLCFEGILPSMSFSFSFALEMHISNLTFF